MPKQTSVNLDITSNPDGFDISGGTVSRKLALTGGNATFVGGGATYTLPSSSTTLLSGANAVSSFNGLTGSVTLTGDGGSLVGAANNVIRARLADTSLTGVASFNPSRFSVSAAGQVDLLAAYQATGDTVITVAGSGIAISTDGRTDTLFNIGVTGVTTGPGTSVSGTTGNIRISNMGVTSFNGLTGAVTLTGDGGALSGVSNNRIIPRLVASGTTGIASFNTTHFSVSSSTGHVSLAAAYTTTGDTVRGDNSAITVSNPSGRLKDVTVRVALESVDPIQDGTTGVAAFFQDHFTVTNGLVKLAAEGGGGGGCPPFCTPLSSLYSGFGASAAPDGSLAYLYLDVGNLTTASEDVASTDNLIFFDATETGLIKTKKANVRKILVDTSSDVFATKTTGQLSFQKDSSSINYNVVLGAVAVGQEGLIKGATAYDYITKNTVASINGQTGAVTCIAVTCAAQTFTGLQTFITGISAANLSVSGGATFGNISASNIVNSLNGLTGARTLTGDGGAIVGSSNTTIGARLATTGVTGVASFNTFHFDVVNGEVSLDPTYQATGDTVSVGSPLTLSRAQNSVALAINAAGNGVSGVASFDSVNFNVSATGHVTFTGGLFTIRDEVGGSDLLVRSDTLTITGGQGVDFLRTGKNNYAIRGATATTGIPGVASFVSTDFSVSSTGHVSLSNVAKTNAANTFSTGLQTISGGLSAGGGVTFSSPIASPGYRYTSSAFETKSAGFTLATADNGKVFVMNNSTTAQVTIDAGLPVGFACEFLVVGAGRVDMVAGNGVTLVQYTERNYPNTRTQLISYATDTFFVSASTPNTV